MTTHRRHSTQPYHIPEKNARPPLYTQLVPNEDIQWRLPGRFQGSPPAPGPHAALHGRTQRTLSREFVVRRISEGETGRLKEELKCEACGKGYKHVSSLAKHYWEHTPEWNITKRLLILKHQQVQLLEAALILAGVKERESVSRRGSVAESLSGTSYPFGQYASPEPVLRVRMNGGYLDERVSGAKKETRDLDEEEEEEERARRNGQESTYEEDDMFEME